MFKTLKNAWGIADLKKKILFTLLIVVLYRLGASIPVPFVDAGLMSSTDAFRGTILQYLNIISGEALGKATLLALGVSPYITASIVVQLLTIAIPPLERWSKEGEEGKKKLNVLTRIITVVLALVTSIGYTMFLDNGYNGTSYLTVAEPNFFHYMIIVLCYCAGAALVMWMAEKINESGIGNGISIILFANIVAGIYTTVATMWQLIFPTGSFKSFDWLGLVVVLAFIVVLLGLVLIVVWMSDAERRIPIQYAKRVVGRKMYGGQNTNLPIKVNMTGVMPIIFANSIVTIPATLAMLLSNTSWKWVEKVSDVITKYFNYDSWAYLVVFMVLLIAFAYFYVMISFNPVEVANNIKNNGGAIPGIRVGRPTVEHIKKILYRVTLVGALLVAFIACFPMLLNNILSINAIQEAFEHYGRTPELYQGLFSTLAFGGSSLMIVVGVALETTRELEAQMTLRNYKGFLD
ncbi:MAG: preprotein translocase subunit SecY [Clostridia bacterium]|nr:preprotein translocase subunit SecY [Clostridia bacterium]